MTSSKYRLWMAYLNFPTWWPLVTWQLKKLPLVTLQVLSSHMCLMTTILKSTDINTFLIAECSVGQHWSR